jgi:hypothetical protein
VVLVLIALDTELDGCRMWGVETELKSRK